MGEKGTMVGIMGAGYYLIQYADGMTSVMHAINRYATAAINAGTAEIVAHEATITDLLMEMVRLGV